LIFVDQTMLCKLRHDRAATKDDEIFARLRLDGLYLTRVKFTEETGIFPPDGREGFREDQLGHLVQCDRYGTVFRRSSSGMVRVRNCAGLVYDNVPPERLEHFVRSTPEDNVSKPEISFAAILACSSSGTTQSRSPAGPAKYPFAVTQLNITIRRIHSIPDIVLAP
jgi:hypothetical protein